MTQFEHPWAAPMTTIDDLPRPKSYEERDRYKAALWAIAEDTTNDPQRIKDVAREALASAEERS